MSRHTGTTTTDQKARMRAEKFPTLRQGLKNAFAIPLIPDCPRKRSRDAPYGPFKEVLADFLHNERVDLARSQSIDQVCIGASTSFDKPFANILRNFNETAKCLVNRHAKLSAADVRTASSVLSPSAAADVTAAAATLAHPPAMPRWQTTRELTAALPRRTPRR